MEKKQYTINEHFVPKCYLNNFTNESNKICVYNKEFKSYSYKTPTQICYEENLYETPYDDNCFLLRNHLENYNNLLENNCSPVLNHIKENFTAINFQNVFLSQKDYNILNQFASNLLLRHPIIMKYFNLDICEDENINNLVNNRYENNSIINKEKIAIALHKIEYLDRRQENSYSTLFERMLSAFNKTLFISKNERFITSDIPFFMNTDSNGNLFQLIVPLSPHCAILYQSLKKVSSKVIISDYLVLQLNSSFMKKGVLEPRYLYGESKENIELIV